MTAPITDNAVLKLLNVESAYGPIKAIRGVSLQVRRSEIATVLGSNGAGKTTILKTISGIIDPRKGSIEFKGENITAQDPAHIVQQGLMHVPEGREVFPLLSVRDNLLMGAYTRADKDAVARDIETVFGYFPILKERAAQDAGLLSGGQQQMLAIARALISEPKVLILDEPTEGIQPSIIKELAQTLNVLRQERGFAVVVSEQVLSFALDLADRFLVIDRGRIVHEEPRANLNQEKVKSFLTV